VTYMEDFIRVFRHIFESRLFSIGKVEITLLVIIEFFLSIIIFYFLSKLLRRFLKRRILTHLNLADAAQFVILKLIHYGMMIIGILIAFNLVGIQLTSLAVGLGVLGVGIAFGLQNITSNFVSGIILLFERHVNVGDYVSVENIIGKVHSINIRSTTIITPDNTVLIVPNSRFIEGTVTNWSVIDPKIRICVPVGVSYGSDTELVTTLLLKVAADNKEVVSEPHPMVVFRGFGDSAFNFELWVWISLPDPITRFRIISDLNYAIDAIFRENRVTIPFPQRDVHLFQKMQ